MHGWLSVWAYVKHKVKKIAYKHSYLYRSLNPPPKKKSHLQKRTNKFNAADSYNKTRIFIKRIIFLKMFL